MELSGQPLILLLMKLEESSQIYSTGIDAYVLLVKWAMCLTPKILKRFLWSEHLFCSLTPLKKQNKTVMCCINIKQHISKLYSYILKLK